MDFSVALFDPLLPAFNSKTTMFPYLIDPTTERWTHFGLEERSG
jgi:hypothetical protein